MAVRIGSARIDENGKAMGGKAGDQTGSEVSTQEWYKQTAKKTWRVFRPINPDVAEKAAWAMQAACDNPNIGYDQAERLSLYNAVRLVGFNPALAKSPVETDCSALVRVCLAYAGITLPNFLTSNEPEALLNSGAFREMIGKEYTESSNYLKRGDVLVTKVQGHTVIVLTDGPYCEEAEPKTELAVRVTSGSWHIRRESTKASVSVGIVKEGTELPYLNETKDGWDKVLFNGAEVWIYSRAGEIVKKEGRKYIEVNGGWHVRTEPKKAATSIGIASNGSRLLYLGQTENGWYHVEFKGKKGWISTKSGKIVE